MVTKNKNTKSATDIMTEVATNAGILLMTAATTLGLVELPNSHEKMAILPTQPTFSFANDSQQKNNPNPIRREREETAPHYTSYSVVQRTPGRTGKY